MLLLELLKWVQSAAYLKYLYLLLEDQLWDKHIWLDNIQFEDRKVDTVIIKNWRLTASVLM